MNEEGEGEESLEEEIDKYYWSIMYENYKLWKILLEVKYNE